MTVLPAYLAPYATRLADLHRRVSSSRFLAATGQGGGPSGHEEYPELTDGRLLSAALAAGDRHHANYLALQYFRVALHEPTARLRHVQAHVTAEWDGDAVSHSTLLAMARTCRTNDERARVREALAAVAGRLRDERLRWLDAYAKARGDLGFGSHGELVRALDPDADAWIQRTVAWLADTRADYLRQWHYWRDLDGIAEPRVRDVLAAGSASLPERVDAVTTVTGTFDMWGFAAERAAIAVDLEPRPGKVSFAFCTPVDPPTDIRVSTGPVRALGDLATLLHEYGHGVHFATLSGVAELVGLPAAAMEAVGLTVEQVAARADWYGGDGPGPRALERLRFRRTATRRLVAASFVFELAVHDGTADPDRRYAEIFGAELDVVTDPVDTYTRLQTYLEGQPCYPLVYTKAYSEAEESWDHLVNACGPSWFLRPEAGPALRSWFARLSGER
jgi:hypothetical protein